MSSSIEGNAQLLADLEDLAEGLAAREPWDGVAVAQSAASILAMNHPGCFASARLDAVLLEAGRRLGPAPAYDGTPGDPRSVLHVLTHASPQGGHTRLAARWIARDAGRRHSVAVTAPIEDETPPALAQAVRASGGQDRTPEVAEADGGIPGRAQAMRRLALEFDAVVLYLDPHDPLPAIALGGLERRPAVLACDVTDHTFGLGRGAIDVHVANRREAADRAVLRRGMPAERVRVLPLPVDRGGPGPDARGARRMLGAADDEIVLLTVGQAYKYEPGEDGLHLLDLVEPVLEQRPRARLIAAGPTLEGRWAQARERTGGRVAALGVVESRDLVAAADVVLESYPTGGSTFSMECAGQGRALLGFAPDEAEAAILGTGSGGNAGWPHARTPEGFRAELLRLIDDAEARAEAGARAQAATALAHDGERWAAEVAGLYALAAELGPLRADELGEPDRGVGAESRVVHRMHVRSGKEVSQQNIARVLALLQLLALDPAWREVVQMTRGGYPIPRMRIPRALAAPSPNEQSIAQAVDLLRALSVGTVVAETVLTLPAADIPGAVPTIEAVLAQGVDFPLDLVPADDPRTLTGEGTISLRMPGDRFAALASA
ncbi:MAG TPA: hypothetical protein VIL49_14685 [Capillimicrobium sp.]